MDLYEVDALSVSIAAVLYVIIHFAWYSKRLFGPIWLNLTGADPEKVSRKRLTYGLFADLCLGFVYAYFLAFVEGYLSVGTVIDGMFVALFMWAGFIATTGLSPFIWDKRPIRLYFIQTGVKLLSILVMGGIVGA